ncbi:MAG: ribonuclease [Lachnospiraceae bacterium]|nr:ribonuclease [Lachnospiraceae bacterium]
MALLFTGCGGAATNGNTQPSFRETEESEADVPEETAAAEPTSTNDNSVTANLPVEGSYYYDLENVVLYLYLYEELPPNYITKNEAEALGWSGGSVERYQDGAAIGGDRFGNREGLLPKADGRKYTECDIDTSGASSRGAKRLVFSNDGLYFYTDDHYESFDEVVVRDDYTVEVLR